MKRGCRAGVVRRDAIKLFIKHTVFAAKVAGDHKKYPKACKYGFF